MNGGMLAYMMGALCVKATVFEVFVSGKPGYMPWKSPAGAFDRRPQ